VGEQAPPGTCSAITELIFRQSMLQYVETASFDWNGDVPSRVGLFSDSAPDGPSHEYPERSLNRMELHRHHTLLESVWVIGTSREKPPVAFKQFSGFISV
jgi:hypothetical protein